MCVYVYVCVCMYVYLSVCLGIYNFPSPIVNVTVHHCCIMMKECSMQFFGPHSIRLYLCSVKMTLLVLMCGRESVISEGGKKPLNQNYNYTSSTRRIQQVKMAAAQVYYVFFTPAGAYDILTATSCKMSLVWYCLRPKTIDRCCFVT